MVPRNAYRILHVDPQADTDVIAAAYRVLARKLHPDTDSSGRDARRMTELNWAYAILRDPAARARYDRDQRAAPPYPDPGSANRPHGAPWESPVGSEVRLDFGRYEGSTLREVARRDVEYLRWLSRHAAGARYRQAIDALLREHEARKKTSQAAKATKR
jgi:DnaJ-class molecular chaperone